MVVDVGIPHDVGRDTLPTAQDVSPDTSGPVDTLVLPDVLPDILPDIPPDIPPDVGPDIPAPPEPDYTPADSPPAPPTLTQPAISAIQQAIVTALDDPAVAGHVLSALVLDEATGIELYAENPDTPMKPASNTKLYTTAAAFGVLGPEHRFLTDIWADGPIDAAGTLTGDLVLVGRHDFTWSTRFYSNPRLPLDHLADQLWQAGLRSVTGTTRVTGELVWDGYHFGYYDPSAHRQATATQLAAALADRGISINALDTATGFDPPPNATRLAEWRSVPLTVACSPLNKVSHNEFADALSRHLGWAIAGESSYAAGSQVILDWLASAGIDATGAALNDGSGLSHDNRVTARQTAGLLRLMPKVPWGPAWNRTLSIAGVDGTLAGRMTWADTLGRVFGKSGTINGVITTSGYLVNIHDGRRYTFSLLMNQVPDQPAARAVEDAVIHTFAGDLLLAQRPAPPTLGLVTRPNPESLHVTWTSTPSAVGHRVAWSADGRVWATEQTLYTQTPDNQALIGPLPAWPARLYVRVTAIGPTGLASDPSDTYATRWAAPEARRLLLVDGNDRWQAAPVPENTLHRGHRFMADQADALDQLAYDTCPNEAVTDGLVALADYDAVFWHVGEESADDVTFDPAEQVALTTYLDGGGSALVSGAEIGWDLVEEGTDADAAFFQDTLRATYAGDDSGAWVAEGIESTTSIFADLPPVGFYTPGGMVVYYPEQLAPNHGSEACLSYLGGIGGTAALQYDGPDYRLVHLGFPLESVDNVADRKAMTEGALSFFDLL